MSRSQGLGKPRLNATEVFVAILGVPEKFRGARLVQEFLDKKIPFVQINGINADAFAIPEDWKNRKRSHFMNGRQLTDGEIACTWGHMRALQTGLVAKANWILIVEDNVNPKNIFQIVESLKNLEIPKPTLISFFYSQKYNIPTKKRLLNGSIIVRSAISIPTGTKCYAVNMIGQKILLDLYSEFGFQGFLADFPLFYGRNLSIFLSENLTVSLLDSTSLIGDRKSLKKRPKFERIYSAKWGFLLTWLKSERISLFVFLRFNLLRTLAEMLDRIGRIL